MKRKIFKISAEMLKQIFSEGLHNKEDEITRGGIPADAKIIDVRFKGFGVESGSAEFLLESEKFPEISTGEMISFLDTEIKQSL